MSEFDDLNKWALLEALQMMGENVQYKGKNLTAIVSMYTSTREVNFAIVQLRAINVVLPRDVLLVPVVGETVIYEGKAFRVESVKSDSNSFELSCETDSK
jgi:hypothetical protein